MSDRTYTKHTRAHTKDRSFLSTTARTEKQDVMFHLLLSLGEHGSAELHTHIQTFSTHSMSAIMSRVGREDLEHPHCVEGLFSRASRVSVCFLLLITEQ